MKVQEKQYDRRKVRPIYDRAKTPLQRLQRSQELSVAQGQAFQALDPVRLFEQVKALQQALFAHATCASPSAKETGGVPLLRFGMEGYLSVSSVASSLTSKLVSEPYKTVEQSSPSTRSLLEWYRTSNDPFKEDWERIASWVVAHPERTSGEIFRELQRLFPDRYLPSHLPAHASARST